MSSRSHCVLTLYVDGVNEVTGTRSFGKLHLVDLAGSERLKVSLSTGAMRALLRCVTSGVLEPQG